MPPAPSTPAIGRDYPPAVFRRDGKAFQHFSPIGPPTLQPDACAHGPAEPRPRQVLTPRLASHTGGNTK